MKTRFVPLIILGMSLVPSVVVNAQWKWVEPQPQGNTIISSVVVGNKAYFMGESSTVFSTSDGGNSWTVYPPYCHPREGVFIADIVSNRLCFTDSLHGFICSPDQGLLYGTSDGGESWASAHQNLWNPGSIYFSSARYGFTTDGLFRTTDGGTTWDQLSATPSGQGYFCGFTSTDSCHVWNSSAADFGTGGRIKYTSDGGASWIFQNTGFQSNSDTTYSLDAIHMNPSGVGIAAGYAYSNVNGNAASMILRTTDFGNTWLEEGASAEFNTIISISDSLWILIGNDWWGHYGTAYQTVISRSTDGGISWRTVYQPQYPFPAPRTGVWIPSQKILLAAGWYGVIYKSTDLGQTWAPLADFPKTLHDITFTYEKSINTSFGYAVGDWGTFLRSTDRGSSWTKSEINFGFPYYLLCVEAKDNFVWAGGNGQTLALSSDFGNTWRRVQTPWDSPIASGNIINQISMYDSLRCAVLASNSYYSNSIMKTDAVGEPSTKEKAAHASNFTKTVSGRQTFTRPDAVTDNGSTLGSIIYTSDGGDSWKTVASLQGMAITAVALPGPQYMLAGGYKIGDTTYYSGFICASSNAGQSWEVLTSVAGHVTKISMFNCLDGLALTDKAFYRTTDGGKSWHLTFVSETKTPSLISIPSEKKNSAVVFIYGNQYATYPLDQLSYTTNKGATWSDIDFDLPTFYPIEGFASIDGPSNLFMSFGTVGFAAQTSPTSVVYQPPDMNRIPPSGTFTVSPDTLPPNGGEVSLSWKSDDAEVAWLGPGFGQVDPGGSKKVKVNGPTEFSLRLQNQWGSTNYVVSVSGVPFSEYSLSQNFPNPFNPSTTIEFNLPVTTHVSLEIYNVLGQKMTTLEEGYIAAGQNKILWDASKFPSGIYFYRLSVGTNSYTRKLLLLK